MLDRFKEEGIIREGHFLLTSGRHSNLYIDKDRIFRSNLYQSIVCDLATLAYKHFDISQIDVITGPAVAGAVLAAPVCLEIQRRAAMDKPIYFVYPEKIDGKMVFRRGYDEFLWGRNVLIVEDIVTTGKSIMQTVAAIYACGGTVEGTISVWNRTGWQYFYFSVISLINELVESWAPENCLLCQEKRIPLTDPKK